MNYPNNRLAREKGPVRVTLVCLGERCNFHQNGLKLEVAGKVISPVLLF